MTGTKTHGSSLTIAGGNFGTKSRNTQWLWDDFNGTNGATAIEDRTTANSSLRGVGRWMQYSHSSTLQLSNGATRSTPSRTTSIYMRNTGAGLPGFGVGDSDVPSGGTGNGSIYPNVNNATSLANRQLLSGSSHIYLSWWMRYKPATGANNIKLTRWHTKEMSFSSTTPESQGNWFASPPNDMSVHDKQCNINCSSSAGGLNDGSWHYIQHIIQWSPTQNLNYHRFYKDCVLYVDTNPAGQYDNVDGGVYSEGNWAACGGSGANQLGVYAWEDQASLPSAGAPYDDDWYGCDFYVDEGPARVEIGDASTYAACAHREMQPFTAWADGSITITLNRGTFGASDTVYVFVLNDNDEPSSGFQITLGT